MSYESIGLLVLCLLAGILLGIGIASTFFRLKMGKLRLVASKIVEEGKKRAEELLRSSELQVEELTLKNRKEEERLRSIERKKIRQEEERIKIKEDKLEERTHRVEKTLAEIEKRELQIEKQKKKIEKLQKEMNEKNVQVSEKLSSLCSMSAEEAKKELIATITSDVKSDAAQLIKRVTDEAEEEAELRAKKVIATAINRVATSYVSEATTYTVQLPIDEMKGRIIGREGRNIRAFERETGINLIMDETPGAVILSGFDPVRKQIAKSAITELILDGRIHPSRIEESVARARESIEQQIKEYGEDAAQRTGCIDLHPDIITLLGKLKFRYSYGQNILDHSIEVSHIMGIIADELHLNVSLAKKIGLLHDMGKALSSEVEGPHAVIGHNVALKCGESVEVANGIGCHHDEMEAITVEGSLCGAADAISASRPGARAEAVEEYIKRIQKLEELVYEFPGVERAYALQAGKEIRVTVLPDMVDDEGTVFLARDISKKIQKNFNYPGKIKVTLIREKRAVEYAT